MRSPDWPAAYRNYSVFVASPSLTRADVDQVHADIPVSKVLAYYCSSWVYLGGSACNMSRYHMRDYFNASDAITNIDTGQPACIVFGPSGGVAGYVFSKRTADTIANYHQQVTLRAANWDGIYLDELDDQFPGRWKTTILRIVYRRYESHESHALT